MSAQELEVDGDLKVTGAIQERKRISYPWMNFHLEMPIVIIQIEVTDSQEGNLIM